MHHVDMYAHRSFTALLLVSGSILSIHDGRAAGTFAKHWFTWVSYIMPSYLAQALS